MSNNYWLRLSTQFRNIISVALVVVAVLSSSCSGGDEPAPTPTPTAPTVKVLVGEVNVFG
ncbi:MAG: hypothetical protein J6U03_02640 [Muribaculaceae bacterium]|nr:hypothetical protein [Muribaculaceae bacterium]